MNSAACQKRKQERELRGGGRHPGSTSWGMETEETPGGVDTEGHWGVGKRRGPAQGRRDGEDAEGPQLMRSAAAPFCPEVGKQKMVPVSTCQSMQRYSPCRGHSAQAMGLWELSRL